MKANIAHIITLISLSVGILSIIESCYFNLDIGAYLILLCCGLDFLDGLIARKLNISSAFGKQLDSFCDLVTFGVAPGILIYNFIYFEFNNQTLAHIALLIPIFSILRLANYSIDTNQKHTFSGLTTPASALLFSSIPLINIYEKNDLVLNILINETSIILLSIIIPILLITPFNTFNIRIETIKKDIRKLIFIFFSICILYIFNFTGFVIIIITYILLNSLKLIN